MKKRVSRITLAVLAAILFAVLVGPFVIPVPPLKGTLPPQALADADSQFIEINGLSVHVKTRGQGQPVFVLLHGFGASLYSWHSVMEPLSQLGTVIAFDRPAFGLSERPLAWKGNSPSPADPPAWHNDWISSTCLFWYSPAMMIALYPQPTVSGWRASCPIPS